MFRRRILFDLAPEFFGVLRVGSAPVRYRVGPLIFQVFLRGYMCSYFNLSNRYLVRCTLTCQEPTKHICCNVFSIVEPLSPSGQVAKRASLDIHRLNMGYQSDVSLAVGGLLGLLGLFKLFTKHRGVFFSLEPKLEVEEFEQD